MAEWSCFVGTHYLAWLLLNGWWRAGRLARGIMFVTIWAALFDLRIGPHAYAAEDGYSASTVLKVIACGVIAWLLAGLPAYLRAVNAAGWAWHWAADPDTGSMAALKLAARALVSPSRLLRLSR